MFNILIVEDEDEINSIIMKYLVKNDFSCIIARNGFEGLQQFSKHSFHLVILDIMMPGIDGFEVLKAIREISEVPVIMLTARQEETDRLRGFKSGADDYIVKPFSPRELVERVKVILKRVYHRDTEIILKNGDLKLYTLSMKLWKQDREIEITTSEFKLLYTLMRNANHVLSRDQIISLSFGHGYDGYDRNIDVYIKRIRNKIEDDPKNPQYLKTKYGQGYIFVSEDE